MLRCESSLRSRRRNHESARKTGGGSLSDDEMILEQVTYSPHPWRRHHVSNSLDRAIFSPDSIASCMCMSANKCHWRTPEVSPHRQDRRILYSDHAPAKASCLTSRTPVPSGLNSGQRGGYGGFPLPLPARILRLPIPTPNAVSESHGYFPLSLHSSSP